jgi:hypothetical protein
MALARKTASTLGGSQNGRRVDTFTLKACIDSLQRELVKVEAMATELARVEAMAQSIEGVTGGAWQAKA